ncbi:alginate export family protein [Adhaeribacter pallidiroseus]|uniref:Alginate export domain-containing protein n=1 Tax=Adhaeribacter pallidiroseus TaxID=2072847 RepID=A0A369QE13_9BACT|nr:alginate export family protein [Adhaeribacter pallidiroseus]RDC61487.1 hypothetical protein AHMF7616_00066 [Adhaeribacter pallidiroseus]
MKKIYLILFLALFAYKAQAQFTLSGQLRTRTELRDGFGNLPNKGASPAFFTSQRARLNVGYSLDKIKFFTTIQDVRIWGQDASTISNADGNKLMLHEMWAEIALANAADSTAAFKGLDYLGLKIGRQEISYDDQRLLGNLDWLQQARRHDAAILKLMHKGIQLDVGVAYNQNAETKEGRIYVPSNVHAGTSTGQIPITGPVNPAGTNGIGQMYKSFQYVYLSKKVGAFKLSGLFFKDDFQKSTVTPTGRVFTKGLNSRLTTGFNAALLPSPTNKLMLNISAYQQGHQDKEGNPLDAYFASIYSIYSFGAFSAGPGFDFYSGNNGEQTTRVNHRFDPLYGTPHKFSGLMDYFYAADGHGPAGLKDFYVKSRYIKGNFSTNVDLHQFLSGNQIAYRENNADVLTRYQSNLGTEVDVISTFTYGKYITFEAGYAHLFGTNSLNRIKTSGFPAANNTFLPKQRQANWAYLMINIKPEFLATKATPQPKS